VIWTIWFPSIAGRHVFVQEQLYLPVLFLALAAIAVGWRNERSPGAFATGGALLGMASLIRAMPLYFLPVLLPLLWLSDAERRRGLRRALAVAGGFLVVVAPYVIWISAARGRLVLIDDHMAIEHLASVGGGTDPTSFLEGLGVVARWVWNTAGQKLGGVAGMFQVYGSGWLRFYSWAETSAEARFVALLTHTLLDTLWLVTCLAAPMGLVMARHRQTSAMLAAWSGLVIVASVSVGDVGARYRAPMEIACISGAAVVFAGRWRNPGPWRGTAGAVVSLLLITIVPAAYFRAIEGKAPYGTVVVAGESGVRRSTGGAGFYLPTNAGRVVFQVEPEAGAKLVELNVRIDGYQLATVRAEEGAPRVVTLPAKAGRLAFIELEPTGGRQVDRGSGYLIHPR
jgi:hypothetical protein